jgi:hypothetical protein
LDARRRALPAPAGNAELSKLAAVGPNASERLGVNPFRTDLQPPASGLMSPSWSHRSPPLRVIRAIRGDLPSASRHSPSFVLLRAPCALLWRIPPLRCSIHLAPCACHECSNPALNSTAPSDIMYTSIDKLFDNQIRSRSGPRGALYPSRRRDGRACCGTIVLARSALVRQNQNPPSFVTPDRRTTRRFPRRLATARDKTREFWHAHVGPPARGAKSKTPPSHPLLIPGSSRRRTRSGRRDRRREP